MSEFGGFRIVREGEFWQVQNAKTGVVQAYADTMDSFRRRENAVKLAAWCCNYAKRTAALEAGLSYRQAEAVGKAAEAVCISALTAECPA